MTRSQSGQQHFLQAVVSVLAVCQHLLSIWCILQCLIQLIMLHSLWPGATCSLVSSIFVSVCQCLGCLFSICLTFGAFLSICSSHGCGSPVADIVQQYSWLVRGVRCGGPVAWLWVGQASRVFQHLRDVIAVAVPGLLRHLPCISDLGIKLWSAYTM